MRKFIVVGLCGMSLAAACFAQTKGGESDAPAVEKFNPAPVVSPQQKVEILDARHKLDAIDKQMSDLNVQLLQLQQQATQKYADLQKQHDAAAKILEAAEAKVKVGVDDKKWVWDLENLGFNPAKPPDAQAKR